MLQTAFGSNIFKITTKIIKFHKENKNNTDNLQKPNKIYILNK